MRAYDFILEKQIQWALNQGITLIGSKGQRGRRAYTPSLEQNLFEPLDHHVHECFRKGDGAEIFCKNGNPAKMQAVHSSSALSVNIFQYWQKIGQVSTIAAVCDLCRRGSNVSEKIVFEEKFKISEKFQYSPNIDVVIHNSNSTKFKLFAIECKFSESYTGRRNQGLKPEYLRIDSIWDGIPRIRDLAQTICPNDEEFHHLHPAQLIKHILGLKCAEGIGKDGFRLLYLWYDVFGREGAVHREEIERFSNVVKSDGVKFHAMSYQELIVKLSKECRAENGEYIEYISNRYL